MHIKDIFQTTAQHTRVRRRRRRKRGEKKKSLIQVKLLKDNYRVKNPELGCRERISILFCCAFVHLVSLTQPQGCCASKASSLLEEADLTANASEVSTTNGTQERPWRRKFCSRLRIWHQNVKSSLVGNYISKNKKNPKQNLMFEVHLFSANAYAGHQHVYIDSVKQTHHSWTHTKTFFFMTVAIW